MWKNNEEYIAACREFINVLCEEEKGYFNDSFQTLLTYDDYPCPAFLYVYQSFQLSYFAAFIVLCAFVYEIDMEFVEYTQQKSNSPALSLGVVVSLYSRIHPIIYRELYDSIELMEQDKLIEKETSTYLFQLPIRLKQHVVSYLLNECIGLCTHVSYYNPRNISYADIHHDVFIAMKECMDRKEGVALNAGENCGKKTILKRICEETHTLMFIIDMAIYCGLDKLQQKECLDYVLFYESLNNSMMYVEHASVNKELCQYLISEFSNHHIAFVISSDIEFDVDLKKMYLPYYLSSCDVQTMSEFLDVSAQMYTSYHLNPKEMVEVFSDNDEIKTKQRIIRLTNMQTSATAIYQILENNLSWDAWLGDEGLKEELQFITFVISHMREFAYSNVLRKGACTALFHGPSGTGKTFASSIIGSVSGLPVWQINLSAILDKYIGESEKHLQKLFQEAEKKNCILLFDEADVLFSKRTAIQSSNDKYANTSTAYLLQKLENYEGAVIMTSNYLQNFDDAFLRRIHYIVRFPLPDNEVKTEKWKRCFQNTPIANELPYELMTKELNLSLAQIDNVYQNSYLHMLKNHQTSMKKEHVLKAIHQECQKKQEKISISLKQKFS